MSTLRIDPKPATAVDVFDAARPPVLRVDPGDTVTVRTLSAAGYTERQSEPGAEVPTLLPSRRGHCLVGRSRWRAHARAKCSRCNSTTSSPTTGGTRVRAALTPPSTRAFVSSNGVARPAPVVDRHRRGTASNQFGLAVRNAPFLGVVGLPPEPTGEHSTIPPRPVGGGNVDCRELVAGSTLFLPVTVPDALLWVGDGHAAQGDGEVSGTAIECGMTTTMTLSLLDETPVAGIHADTPAGRITFGFDPDLNTATTIALDAMVDWIAGLFDIGRAEALAMASVAVSMRITQVANRTWGVHALLPEGAISRDAVAVAR
ncbi:acetamidase/formamidase family protein [Curtobacterium sp. B8]|uniref:acetamidase/formamidase family protein n=1 Tax=Curtobacterium sp. B8 TaxID=95611 RepID=UPI0003465C0C|nr:acetamidase/formamidase family protein [Curtobacterium sp. B8]